MATLPTDNELTSAPELVRIGQWTSDQDVVLIADDKKKAFRINRAFLCNASEVFRDMFKLPQPPNEDMMDNCVVIRLQDSSGDLDALLKVLCDGFGITETSLTFNAKLGILRGEYIRRRKGAMPNSKVVEATKLLAAVSSHIPKFRRIAFYEIASSDMNGWSEDECAAVKSLGPDDMMRLFRVRERRRHMYHFLWSGCIQEWFSLSRRSLLSTFVPSYISHLAPQKTPQCSSGQGQCSQLSSFVTTVLGSQVHAGASPDLVLRRVEDKSEIVATGACEPCAEWLFTLLRAAGTSMWDGFSSELDSPRSSAYGALSRMK